jgi:hypothetical protein
VDSWAWWGSGGACAEGETLLTDLADLSIAMVEELNELKKKSVDSLRLYGLGGCIPPVLRWAS